MATLQCEMSWNNFKSKGLNDDLLSLATYWLSIERRSGSVLQALLTFREKVRCDNLPITVLECFGDIDSRLLLYRFYIIVR